ncbi:MAG TPA: hypothetical protein VFQ35_06400 [Polyangiaceae bacterium]|nr:hypothetical protein [Polyangiaceae bacterium]
MLNHRLGLFGASAVLLFAVTHCGDSDRSSSGGLHSNGGKPSNMGGAFQEGGASGAPLASGGTDDSGGTPGSANGGTGASGASHASGGGSSGGRADAGGSVAAGGAAGGQPDGSGGGACAPAPAPGGVYDGDLYVGSAEELGAAHAYSRITGCLTLGVALGDVSLPNLVSLGSLNAQSSTLTRLSLPNVQRIDGELWLYLNFSLTEVDLRRLKEVGGRLYIHRNIMLSSLQLIALESVNGSTTRFDTESGITGNIRLPECMLDVPKARFESFVLTSGLQNCSCSIECDLVTADGC